MKKTMVGLVVALFVVSIFATAVFSSSGSDNSGSGNGEDVEAVVGNEGEGNLEDAAEDVEAVVGNEGEGNLEDAAEVALADKEKRIEFSKTTTDELGNTKTVTFEKEVKVADGMKEAEAELEIDKSLADGSSATTELEVELDEGVFTVESKRTMTSVDGVTTTSEVEKDFTDKSMAVDFIHAQLEGIMLPSELMALIHHHT